ncbi:acyl carrier protein [Actinomadura sp. KC06]|uniref:phosphopantetheine-binding protein n=1 Tax=Actinomadura sp. KC06 TaxID=2530369 RepID=UPI00104E252E|nr:phosphopantetheine-binding protein [Actinomadura sp. KC06]TDD28856.1 acyl carrier protein [Actinomadura sp. KC06]
MTTPYQTIVSVLTDRFDVAADRISPDTTLSDLELDSVAIVELGMYIQEQWPSTSVETDIDSRWTLARLAELAGNSQAH